MKDKILHKALTLSKRRKYGEAITLLDGEVFHYRESFRYYYILALACLKQGEFGRAYSFFKSAHDLKNRDANVLLGIAVINLKRGESERAVDLYLKVLDIEPNNRRAQYALAVLRKYGGSEELASWLESGKIRKLYPPFPKEKNNALKYILAAAGVLALGTAGAILFGVPSAFQKTIRDGFDISALNTDDKNTIVETDGAYRIILTEKEVLDTYENARKNFNSYKDNSARVSINKIMLSNASAGIKNKARLLLEYIDQIQPGFNTLTEQFAYRDIKNNSELYDGCYVIWSGMGTNLVESADETSFDLLVGYENRRELLGTVPVHCPFAFKLDLERPIDVLGRVGSNPLTLEGVSIHQR